MGNSISGLVICDKESEVTSAEARSWNRVINLISTNKLNETYLGIIPKAAEENRPGESLYSRL